MVAMLLGIANGLTDLNRLKIKDHGEVRLNYEIV
jgi:hypothetical protein